MKEAVFLNRKKIPSLCGSKEVADILDIKPTSIPSTRGLKGFPEPIQILASGPIWLEEEIKNYKSLKNKVKQGDE